jgi:hypothetical protein
LNLTAQQLRDNATKMIQRSIKITKMMMKEKIIQLPK